MMLMEVILLLLWTYLVLLMDISLLKMIMVVNRTLLLITSMYLLSVSANVFSFWKNQEAATDWTWGRCCTDGTVMGPIDFYNPLGPQSITVTIVNSYNLNNFSYVNYANGALQDNWYKDRQFTIERISCASKSKK